MIDILLCLGGLVGLLIGGEILVRGAVGLAASWGLSAAMIGATVVAFGTSAPELVTSLQAALAGAPGIALGNVVGSNTANILLILGLTALIAPIAVGRAAIRRDLVAAVLAAIAGTAAVMAGFIGRGIGAALIAGLVAYILWSIRTGGAAEEDEAVEEAPGLPWRAAALALGGLLVTIAGARALVTGAVSIAGALGVSDAVIGLTLVAVGTSLPELATSVIAARRGRADLALGNILGSNVFNILAILGLTALVAPLEVPTVIASRDIWVMLAATGALALVVLTGRRVVRGEGAALTAAYAVYLGWLVMTA